MDNRRVFSFYKGFAITVDQQYNYYLSDEPRAYLSFDAVICEIENRIRKQPGLGYLQCTKY